MKNQTNLPKDVQVMRTDNIDVRLPMNTKYVSGNPISQALIRNFLKTLIQLLTNLSLEPRRVLDIGCGEGLVLRQLRRLWPQTYIDGLDIEMELMAVAQKLVPDIHYLGGSVYHLPLPTMSYDLVLCTEVLEHLEHPESALAEITRVGSEYFLLSVPNEPWWRLANMARGSYLTDWGNTPGHVNHWNSRRVIQLVNHYFQVIEVKRPFPWTMVLGQKL